MATGVTSSITSNVSFTDHYQLTKDDDTLIISGATVTMLKPEGDIFTDMGNDTVQIEDTLIFTDQPNLEFKLGSGDDTMTVKNTTFSAPVSTGSGNDVVVVDGTVQTKVRLNKSLSFGTGNDLLELISMLENAGSINFGTDGTKTLRFNGGALLPVQIEGSTAMGTIGSFTDLDVTIAGGTTGSNLTLAGEQTSITLNGNFFGTTNDKDVSVSGGTTTLSVVSNVRTNVRLKLNQAKLIHVDGAILEFSDHTGYAVTADESIVDLHDIVVKGAYGLYGSNTDWDIDNSDFSNGTTGINLTDGALNLQTVGMANYTSTAMILSGTTLTGSKMSLMSNQGKGAIQITSGGIEITDFRVYNNLVTQSSTTFGGAILQNGGNMALTSASFSGNVASASASGYAFNGISSNYASAFGGAIYQNGGGDMAMTSASFSGNIVSVFVIASATAEGYVSPYGGGAQGATARFYAYASAFGGAIYQNGGNMTLNEASFFGNTASASGSEYTSRYLKADNANAQTFTYTYGGAIYQNGGNMIMTSASFSGNRVSAKGRNASAYGGAIYQNAGNMTLIHASFSGNDAYANGGPTYGGAVCLSNMIANMEDCFFSNNLVSAGANAASASGGAVYLDKTTLNYVVTSGENVNNIGNKANTGGWLYAGNQSTVNITVENEGLLTIGDENNKDSIAGTSDSRITKNGTGYMLVNSDITDFTGLWSVMGGTLELARIARTLKLDDWTIGTDATLVLSVLNDTINMNMSKKIGTIDMGGGSDTINTSGYNLTDGTVLLSDLTLTGGGRVSVRLRNRSTTAGSTLRLNGIYLDNEFTGNEYMDTILITAKSTLNGAIDLKNGDNVISATALATFGSTLNAGSGKDTLSFTSASFADAVDLGDGDNSLTATGTAKFSKAVAMGSGNDTLSFADVTFEDTLDLGDGDNSLTATGTAKLQDIKGGSGNDTITLDAAGTISGVIDLGGGRNRVHVNQSLTADEVRITEGGETSIYIYLGSTLTDNTLTVYSDEAAARDTITLNWSAQTDLDKVRILVSKDSTFETYELNLALYNQTKSFTLNLERGYFIQFQANDDDGWRQRLLDDTVAPNQVTGVVFNGSVLTWDETHDNLSGNGVKQYHVEVSDNASFSNIIQSDTVTGTEYEYAPASLAEKTLYFRVCAEDYTNNIGAWSATVSGMFDNTPPSRPSGGKSTVNGYNVNLSWSAASDTGSGVARYEYRVASDSDYGQIVTDGTTEACSLSVENLNYGTYYWSVRAVDAASNAGSWSLSKSFSTVDLVAPGEPTNLDYGIEDKTSLVVIWDAAADDALGSGLKCYEIQLATDSAFGNVVKTVSVTDTETVIKNLPNATYYMRVCSVDNAGNKSAWTDTVDFTISGGAEPEPEPADDKTAFFIGDFNGDGKAMLAVQSGKEVTIYQNGEPWGFGRTLDPGWEIAGVGDFNGDGNDDFLRLNGEGYVVGDISSGNGLFGTQVLNFRNTGWDILGTGDFDGDGTDDVLIANPTAASETVGLLGYWKGGTEWTLINGYSAEWECVSTGDFNGDGKCDMLWRNSFVGEGGLTYNAYCTWIVEDPVDWRMVSVANPAEWNFLCSGDFDGDKMNDIAMINDVGVVGIWGVNDGYLSSWSILSAVTSEWTLAGVANFNGDGTDDIAWSNTDTGLVGYWQINDKELTTWANIVTLS